MKFFLWGFCLIFSSSALQAEETLPAQNLLSFNQADLSGAPRRAIAEPEATSELNMPAGALQLARSHDYLLWAETKASKLHLLERNDSGALQPVKSMPMSIGKEGYGKRVEGDKRTPIGVYRITSFLSEAQLDDFYGSGAYPIDYPNALDKRLKRTGHGIWLHGLPQGVDSRPPRDSDGCVVINNTDLEALAGQITTGDTYLVISEDFEWQSLASSKQQLQPIKDHFERWLTAWQSLDNDIYLDYYAKDFSNLEKGKQAWDSYKRRIHKNKRFIDVSISDLSVFTYPGEENLVTVRYYQSYKSSNYQWQGWKEQLWGLRDGEWKIVYEGDA